MGLTPRMRRDLHGIPWRTERRRVREAEFAERVDRRFVVQGGGECVDSLETGSLDSVAGVLATV